MSSSQQRLYRHICWRHHQTVSFMLVSLLLSILSIVHSLIFFFLTSPLSVNRPTTSLSVTKHKIAIEPLCRRHIPVNDLLRESQSCQLYDLLVTEWTANWSFPSTDRYMSYLSCPTLVIALHRIASDKRFKWKKAATERAVCWNLTPSPTESIPTRVGE